MKKFIFRSPFVTKQDRRIAKTLVHISDTIHEVSDVCYEKGDNINGRKLLIESIMLLDMATKCLGFRNTSDMHEYRKRHGRI